MSKKILVLGSTGNVGSKVVNYLLDKKQYVKAAVRPGKSLSQKSEFIEQVEFDYTNKATFDMAFEGVDRIFFLSPPLDHEAPQKLNPFIDAAKAKGIKRFVLLSALGVDKAEGSALEIVEKHLKNSNVDYTIVRPTFFMENFSQGWMAPSIKQGTLYVSAGEGKTGFIASENIAEVVATVLSSSGHEKKEYNLTGPSLLDYHEVVKIISEKTGRNIKYIPISDADMRAGAKQNGMPDSAIEYLSTLYHSVSAGYTAVLTNEVKNITGKEPISLSAFAEKNKEKWLAS